MTGKNPESFVFQNSELKLLYSFESHSVVDSYLIEKNSFLYIL